MKIKHAVSFGIVFFGVLSLLSGLYARGGEEKMTEERFNHGIQILKENNLTLIGYYWIESSRQEGVRVTDFAVMTKLIEIAATTRFILHNDKTGEEKDVTTIKGEDMSEQAKGEGIWQVFCRAAGVYKQCAEFFGWK